MKFLTGLAASLVVWSAAASAQEVESKALSDKIYRGDGTINLLRDISGSDLTRYFNETGGLLLLGADINEDASGNESNKSVGVAIKQAQLSISTSAGDFTFTDFFTSTSAMLREAGSETAREYATLFGQGGSSQITGSGSLDISKFDDVMWFENIAFKGTITSAKLSISLLETPNSKAQSAESFFDFSGGFEDFALFNIADSVLIEEANIGMAAAPDDVKYTVQENVIVAIKEAIASTDSGGSLSGNGGSTPVTAPPAAPAPPLLAVAALGLLVLLKKRRSPGSENA
jgi:hypothetical protein